MQKYPGKEWNRLIGAPVEVRRNGITIRSGTVEEAMPDSSILWIAADAEYGRKLFTATPARRRHALSDDQQSTTSDTPAGELAVASAWTSPYSSFWVGALFNPTITIYAFAAPFGERFAAHFEMPIMDIRSTSYRIRPGGAETVGVCPRTRPGSRRSSRRRAALAGLADSAGPLAAADRPDLTWHAKLEASVGVASE